MGLEKVSSNQEIEKLSSNREMDICLQLFTEVYLFRNWIENALYLDGELVSFMGMQSVFLVSSGCLDLCDWLHCFPSRALLGAELVAEPELEPPEEMAGPGRLLEKRGRSQQLGFSSWAGKRSGRNSPQAFNSWAGKVVVNNFGGREPLAWKLPFNKYYLAPMLLYIHPAVRAELPAGLQQLGREAVRSAWPAGTDLINAYNMLKCHLITRNKFSFSKGRLWAAVAASVQLLGGQTRPFQLVGWQAERRDGDPARVGEEEAGRGPGAGPQLYLHTQVYRLSGRPERQQNFV